MKKNNGQIIFFACLSIVFLAMAILIAIAYTRKPLEFTFDAAYNQCVKSYDGNPWRYEELPTGHKYYLYLPEDYRKDKDNEDAKIPLIVVFHGSCEKAAALKYGRFFISEDFQKKIYPKGAAVLATMSRIDYYTDPASMSLLIQNVVLKNKCIDPTNIIGYGFSQGAKFVAEVACKEPRLFRGIICGSGFYQMSAREILSILPVSVYWATSENDKGIFEQSYKTGRRCGFLCRNSRYIQYKSRWHFYVELKDETGKKLKNPDRNETMQDWLISVVNRR